MFRIIEMFEIIEINQYFRSASYFHPRQITFKNLAVCFSFRIDFLILTPNKITAKYL